MEAQENNWKLCEKKSAQFCDSCIFEEAANVCKLNFSDRARANFSGGTGSFSRAAQTHFLNHFFYKISAVEVARVPLCSVWFCVPLFEIWFYSTIKSLKKMGTVSQGVPVPPAFIEWPLVQACCFKDSIVTKYPPQPGSFYKIWPPAPSRNSHRDYIYIYMGPWRFGGPLWDKIIIIFKYGL